MVISEREHVRSWNNDPMALEESGRVDESEDSLKFLKSRTRGVHATRGSLLTFRNCRRALPLSPV